MEHSDLKQRRSTKPSWYQLCLFWSAYLAAIGCGYPDYSYVDENIAGSSGTAGSSTTGGTGATAGTSSGGSAGADAGDADALVQADTVDEADAPMDGCPDVPEDCSNGIDDDCDGLVDCQDADCTIGYTCTDQPPAGWKGVVSVYEGALSDVPICPASYPYLAFVAGREPVAQKASCSACSCGNASGVQCAVPEVFVFTNRTCDANVFWADLLEDYTGGCVGLDFIQGLDAGGAQSVRISEPEQIPDVGSCPASGGIASTQPPSWNVLGVACSTNISGGGCGPNSVCVPKPTSRFKSGVCIYRDGEHSCPLSYINKSTFYQKLIDARGCSACTCEAPTNVSCSGTMTVSLSAQNNSTCTQTEPDVEIIANSSGCYSDLSLETTVHYFQYDANPPSGGSCQTQGGQATGSVTADPKTILTVCCRPF